MFKQEKGFEYTRAEDEDCLVREEEVGLVRLGGPEARDGIEGVAGMEMSSWGDGSHRGIIADLQCSSAGHDLDSLRYRLHHRLQQYVKALVYTQARDES